MSTVPLIPSDSHCAALPPTAPLAQYPPKPRYPLLPLHLQPPHGTAHALHLRQRARYWGAMGTAEKLGVRWGGLKRPLYWCSRRVVECMRARKVNRSGRVRCRVSASHASSSVGRTKSSLTDTRRGRVTMYWMASAMASAA